MIVIILCIILLIFILINSEVLLDKIYPITTQEFYKTDMNWCKMLRDNCNNIRYELLSYNDSIPLFTDIDKLQHSINIDNIPWKTLILRLYNKDTKNMKKFPLVQSLINNVPNCTLAMFSILYPGKHIPTHVGPFKGILRYHLCLFGGNDKCYISVNNKYYIWKDGKDVIFDDTLPHFVYNDSDKVRIVLFLDIAKPFKNIFFNNFNKLILKTLKFNTRIDKMVRNVNNYY
jgi:aspartyl/asparaginyl beta-hydroxylase (cupin superfamily)